MRSESSALLYSVYANGNRSNAVGYRLFSLEFWLSPPDFRTNMVDLASWGIELRFLLWNDPRSFLLSWKANPLNPLSPIAVISSSSPGRCSPPPGDEDARPVRIPLSALAATAASAPLALTATANPTTSGTATAREVLLPMSSSVNRATASSPTCSAAPRLASPLLVSCSCRLLPPLSPARAPAVARGDGKWRILYPWLYIVLKCMMALLAVRAVNLRLIDLELFCLKAHLEYVSRYCNLST
ncbi:uncharacterized protein LOC133895000 [Phragmites australis]|uniref:uncharacterized protein LOC133895000 n=1 Tax=Phragmites australis TaxID=29695 RepID=UPI002D788470|nr:uncharacterized protein LOC133895000 [Phragmites australis]